MGSIGEKLLETLGNAIAGYFAPHQIRRVGKAQTDVKAEEIRLLAAAEKDAEDIRSGAKIIDENGKVVPSPLPFCSMPDAYHSSADQAPDTSRFILDARTRLIYRELKREINLRAIALLARAESVSDEAVSDEPVNDQWAARWVDGAQDVSDKELRILWAKILAGEVKRPGSFSLHTISYLKNMSAQDAKKLERIAGLALQTYYSHSKPKDTFVYIGGKGFEEVGVAVADIPKHIFLELEEEGLINVGGLGFTYTPSGIIHDKKLTYIFLLGRKALVAEAEQGQKALSVKIYRFTRIGAEIVSLGDFESESTYISKFLSDIKEQGFKVSEAPIIKETDQVLETGDATEH